MTREEKMIDYRNKVAQLLTEKGDSKMASRIERHFGDYYILEMMDNHTPEQIAEELL